MSSRSRNFRRRGDDEDENEGNDSSAIPATTRKVSSKPKKLLSFAEDEDEGGEDITKSSRRASSKPSSHKLTSSHKLSSSKERLPANPLSKTSNVQPQAGIYTKEALLDLQKRTPTLAKSTASTKSTSSSSEPKIILKGLLKPSSDDDAVSLFERPVEDEDKEREEKQKDAVGDSTDTENQFASMGLEKSIPDEETIKRIKAKKERMRMSRTAAPDYISLDGGSNQGTAEGFSDEEPEFTTRIAMIGKEDKNNHGVFADIDNDGSDDEKIRVRTMISNVGSFASNVVEDGSKVDVADDEDEEDKIWEEEQFRKGLGKRMDNGSAPTVLPSETPAMMHNQQQSQRPLAYGSIPNTGVAFSTTQGLDALSIPQQAEVAKKALQDSIRRLKESHDRTNLTLTKTAENLSGSLMNITNLEKSLTVAGEKFVFIQKLRDFVSVICEFLQHKAPYIEELEAHLQTFCEDRASANRERRAADNDDEMKEVEAAVKAAMLVFSERGNSAAVIATATGAAESALAAFREQTNLPVDLDEFGRDKNLKRRMDMKRRTEARLRRKARFDAKRLSSMEVDGSNRKIEGESSTDESDSESSAYESARSQYLQTADQIFSDASEEYSQLSLVIERFETWKKEYARSYQDAYMSLNAPAIFSPYVRLELLKWNPLHESKDFLDMKWHSLLFNYGSPEDGSDFKSDDADANLVPELVEKVAIPMLRHAISRCWDTLSTRETENAVFATNLVISYVSASNKALVDLLLAINERLSMAVEGIKVPTWSPHVLKAVPSAARVAAYRFGMSVRLMRNICLWKDVLSLPVLEKLVLDNLLGGKILPHIRSIASNVHDAVARSERVVAALSGVWTGTSVTAENSKKLKSLVDYVVSLGRILEKKQASGVSETETSGLARRLKKMLVELNDYDNARNVVKTFHLKEAL